MKKLILLLLPACMTLVSGCGPELHPRTSSSREVESAKFPITRIAGTYENEDGSKAITIKETFAEDGWNGWLSFSPGVGDWATPVRCRISGSTVLAVEIPASTGRVVIAMFRLDDPRTITGEVSPWQGTFHRTWR